MGLTAVIDRVANRVAFAFTPFINIIKNILVFGAVVYPGKSFTLKPLKVGLMPCATHVLREDRSRSRCLNVFNCLTLPSQAGR